MKILLRLTAKVPGFLIKIGVMIDQALEGLFNWFTRCKPDDDNDPWNGTL